MNEHDQPIERPEVVADDVLRQVDPRAVTVDRITSWIVTGCIALGLMVGLVVVAVAASPPAWVLAVMAGGWLLVMAPLAWLSERYPRLEHDRTHYRLSVLGIEIRKGVFWRRVINVPRSRIQHTDVTQGPLMRRYELAKLVIHTAGTENASVELNGLAHERALRIRDALIRADVPDEP